MQFQNNPRQLFMHAYIFRLCRIRTYLNMPQNYNYSSFVQPSVRGESLNSLLFDKDKLSRFTCRNNIVVMDMSAVGDAIHGQGPRFGLTNGPGIEARG